MPRRFTSGGADVPQLQILLYSLGGVRRVFGDGHGDLHIVVGGELCAPGDERLSRSLVTADGFVQIVDKDVGDVEIACVQAAQEALEHIGGGNAVFPGIHQANLIGYIIGQLLAVLNADDIAVGVRHSRVDGIDQLLGLAGALSGP